MSGIVLLVLIVFVFAIAYGLYTRKGSGINPRPWDGSDGAPGAEGREEVSGHDRGEGSALAQHGTDSRESERDSGGEDRPVGEPFRR
jgi:hypothetical protein